MSGHTLDNSACAPDDGAYRFNCEYLEGKGTGTEIAAVFEDEGDSVSTRYYSDNLYSWGVDSDESGELEDDELFLLGFLRLLRDMEFDHEQCVAGYGNPTSLVVAAHSHGTVWAHSAVMLLEWVEFDYLIDLDGNALCWESDIACLFIGDSWSSLISEYVETEGPAWWFNVANASDSWEIDGLDYLVDIEDIAPPNARVNIEAQANGLPAQDNMDNVRLDGSSSGILRQWFADTHSSVTEPGAEPFEWVLAVLREDAFGPVE